MRVSTKGQVTIPLHLREQTGIMPGSEIEFVREGKRLYLRKTAAPGRGEALVKRMAGRGDVGMSTGEILALTRGDE